MSSVSFIVRPSDSPLHLTSQSVSIGRARDSNMHRAILHRASKVGTCERTGAALVLVVYLRHVGDCSFSRRTFKKPLNGRGAKGIESGEWMCRGQKEAGSSDGGRVGL